MKQFDRAWRFEGYPAANASYTPSQAQIEFATLRLFPCVELSGCSARTAVTADEPSHEQIHSLSALLSGGRKPGENCCEVQRFRIKFLSGEGLVVGAVGKSYNGRDCPGSGGASDGCGLRCDSLLLSEGWPLLNNSLRERSTHPVRNFTQIGRANV